MFTGISMFKPRDVSADKDSDSLDFGPALSIESATSAQKDNSITLWGPGVNVQETPSSILSQSLDVWRKDNAQLSAAQAAEELDKLYENLPPEALDLTFQDMIGRNNTPKRKSDDKADKKKGSPRKSNLVNAKAGERSKRSPRKSNAVNEEVVNDVEQIMNVSRKLEKEMASKLSVTAKIALKLSPKSVHSPSRMTTLSHEELDKLVEKRGRKSKSSDQEGLYSASSTPATSFRRVSSPFTSPKLSPTPSFTDYMLRIDKHSFERELSRSARFLESYLHADGMPPVHEGLPQQNVSPQNPMRTTPGKEENHCSACSTTTNLFFLRTTCLVCGKSFCTSCKNIETKEVIGGFRCKNDCGVELSVEKGFIEERAKGRRRACWSIAVCSCMRK